VNLYKQEKRFLACKNAEKHLNQPLKLLRRNPIQKSGRASAALPARKRQRRGCAAHRQSHVPSPAHTPAREHAAGLQNQSVTSLVHWCPPPPLCSRVTGVWVRQSKPAAGRRGYGASARTASPGLRGVAEADHSFLCPGSIS